MVHDVPDSYKILDFFSYFLFPLRFLLLALPFCRLHSYTLLAHGGLLIS